jgi:hypothetical protein
MKKTGMGLAMMLAFILIAAVTHGCGKDEGYGVGGKVIITGSGS